MISVSGLTKRYGRRVAVDDLTFEVASGRVTGFVGPNGAGKSTTMRAMVGLIGCDAGEVRYAGQRYGDVVWPSRTVGAVLDSTCMHPGRTARDHLRATAALGGIPTRRVDEVLAEVGLESVGDQRAGGFSLGMRQRLALAGALLGDPQALLLDEPSNGLDPDGMRWLRAHLRAFADRGGTVFVSSHLIAELAVFADDVVVVGAGRLIAADSIRAITARQESAVLVETPQPTELARLLAEGIPVDGELVGAAVVGGSPPGEALGSEVVVEASGDRLVVRGVARSRVSQFAFDHQIPITEITDLTTSLEDILLEMTTAASQFTARTDNAATTCRPQGLHRNGADR